MEMLFKWVPKWFFLLTLSILIGGLIGLEQESYHRKREEKHFGGIRTFPLISMLGFSTTYFVHNTFITATVFACFSLMIVGEYVYEAFYFNKKGITTEVAGLFTYIMGTILAKGLVVEAVALSILVTLILSVREYAHTFIERYVYQKDMSTILKFLIVAAIMYPLLPNRNYTFLELNPRSIWLMVVLVSSISFVAYFSTRILGARKGILITALLGGLISSTATTLAFAKRSRELPELSKELGLGVVISSSIMFLRQWFIILVIYPYMSLNFLIFAITLFMVGVGFFFFRRASVSTRVDVNFSNPYEISHALFFGAFYTFILVVAKLAHMYFGSKGVYFSGFLSGLVDVDAITISLTQLCKHGVVAIDIGIVGIIISSITNTLIKGVYASIFGSKELGRCVWRAFVLLGFVSFALVFMKKILW